MGKVINRWKVGKHFQLTITETSFTYHRDEQRVAAEAALDGIYVIRTNVPETALSPEQAVVSYKGLSAVERAFRSIKTVDLHVRPIYHYLPERVRAHVFVCMLAYYLEWHLRKKLAPMLFDDHDPAAARALRSSVVAPAQSSPSAKAKTRTKRTPDGLTAHSFQTLIQELATVAKSHIQPRLPSIPSFHKITGLTPLHKKAFALLGLRC